MYFGHLVVSGKVSWVASGGARFEFCGYISISIFSLQLALVFSSVECGWRVDSMWCGWYVRSVPRCARNWYNGVARPAQHRAPTWSLEQVQRLVTGCFIYTISDLQSGAKIHVTTDDVTKHLRYLIAKLATSTVTPITHSNHYLPQQSKPTQMSSMMFIIF